MELDYTFIWLILQLIIFVILIGPIPIFFYQKYKQDKAKQDRQGMVFDVWLVFFFIFIALNEFVYILSQPEISVYNPSWNYILDIQLKSTLLFEIPLESNYFIIFPLFFLAFIQIIYPVEKFLQKSKRFPLTWLLLIGTIYALITYLLFVIFQLPQPQENLLYQIYIFILVLVSLIGLLTAFSAFIYLYLKLAITTTGFARRKALVIFFGTLFITLSFFGGNLTRPQIGVKGTPVELLGPLLMIPGFVIFVIGFKIKRN